MKVRITKRVREVMSIIVEADSLEDAERREEENEFDDQWQGADYDEYDEDPEFEEEK